MSTEDLSAYLSPTSIIDSDNPAVIEYSKRVLKDVDMSDQTAVAVALYNRVRDDFLYNPYIAFHREEAYRASVVIKEGKGYCVSKAALLCALCRVNGIPARIGFATVKNHIATQQLIDLIGTNEFAYHGFTEILLNDEWVAATPAFDRLTCRRHKVEPLAFNGSDDSKYQAYDLDNNLFMEYVEDLGHYADIPVDKIIAKFRVKYGDEIVDKWIDAFNSMRGIAKRRFDQEDVVQST
ncbi:transglutaminase-like domain-containing protein [Alteromonas sp. a30]|uniref:transglutaminase-like domain-containing protein n=1 Tax=Alteromonas sp. a30 TaxID=2730917 RepID=UPI0022827476|nr:transglutaminase-like domain-containing protein [Alteromonas sp. a30]MCY7296468.1 transglutaminase domain-containing protein [Alteromonas sp. a30]